jgi:hypothetical protein
VGQGVIEIQRIIAARELLAADRASAGSSESP